MYETIDSFTMHHNGNAYSVLVTPDDWPDGDFDFGDEKANADYLARFESGELLCVSVMVKRYDASGSVYGCDSLGMCHVKAQDLRSDVEQIIEEHEMLAECDQDLKTIISNIKTLND